MAEQQDYILGTEAAEIERLRFQHEVWSAAAYNVWQSAGVRAGDRMLDLGCGPGFTTTALAGLVGPKGHVLARDQSPRFLEILEAECARLGSKHIEPSLGPVEDLELDSGSLDGAYARWLFCWLRDPGEVLGRVAFGLRSGGVIALQEYIDWGAMALLPPSPIFDRAVQACMRSWHEGEGTIDIGAYLPALAEQQGLRVESVRPISRIGRVGSLEWRWIEQFLWSYLPKLVEAGIFSEGDWSAFCDEWAGASKSGTGLIQTPTMADIILRKI